MKSFRSAAMQPRWCGSLQVNTARFRSFVGKTRPSEASWRCVGRVPARLVADNVEGVVVPGSGHWLIDEAPGEVIPRLATFLRA